MNWQEASRLALAATAAGIVLFLAWLAKPFVSAWLASHARGIGVALLFLAGVLAVVVAFDALPRKLG